MKHIRILSPASAIDPQWIEKASLRLKEWGVEVSVSTHARGNCGRFSSLDEDRIADLNEAFADDSMDSSAS